MQLTPKDIEDFRKAYREAFGEDVSFAEAEEMAFRVMSLFELIAENPPPKEGTSESSPN